MPVSSWSAPSRLYPSSESRSAGGGLGQRGELGDIGFGAVVARIDGLLKGGSSVHWAG